MGPGLTMQDGAGNGRVALGVGPNGPTFGLTGGGPANTTRFMITTEADAVSLSLLDEGENTRLSLGVAGNTPLLAILNQGGQPVWKAP